MAQCAEAAGRSKGTYLGAQFQRLRGRRGHAKARKAVEHSILVAATTCSTDTSPTMISVPTGSSVAAPKHARRLAQQIEALGFRVTIEPTDQARLNQLNSATPGCEAPPASGHLGAQVTYVFGFRDNR